MIKDYFDINITILNKLVIIYTLAPERNIARFSKVYLSPDETFCIRKKAGKREKRC